MCEKNLKVNEIMGFWKFHQARADALRDFRYETSIKI